MSSFLNAIRERASRAGVFSGVEITDSMLRAQAPNSAEPAWYRVEQADGSWYVSLVTADRWLSESIEADLMHTGDPLEELIEEELVELGQESPGTIRVDHYRSDDMLYTFRTPIPIDSSDSPTAAERASTYLLAYEAAFRELGDMEVDEDDA